MAIWPWSRSHQSRGLAAWAVACCCKADRGYTPHRSACTRWSMLCSAQPPCLQPCLTQKLGTDAREAQALLDRYPASLRFHPESQCRSYPSPQHNRLTRHGQCGAPPRELRAITTDSPSCNIEHCHRRSIADDQECPTSVTQSLPCPPCLCQALVSLSVQYSSMPPSLEGGASANHRHIDNTDGGGQGRLMQGVSR